MIDGWNSLSPQDKETYAKYLSTRVSSAEDLETVFTSEWASDIADLFFVPQYG